MLAAPELLPQFVRFSNLLYRDAHGYAVPCSLEEGRERLLEDLRELRQRLAWELPLICGYSLGPTLGHQTAKTLEGLISFAEQPVGHDVQAQYVQRLEALLGSLRETEVLRAQLPVFSDVRALSEMLILADAHLQSLIDATPLMQRLPLLMDWVERTATDWTTYKRLFPDQEYAVDRVMALIAVMRQGLGGIYLFLQGEAEDGLKEGLEAILRASQSLEPSVETRFHTESERVEFSPDLRLERSWRGADWEDWQNTSLPAHLLSFYQENVRKLDTLANSTLMPYSMLEEANPMLAGMEDRLTESFDRIWRSALPYPSPSPTAEETTDDALAEESPSLATEDALEEAPELPDPFLGPDGERLTPRQARGAALAELEACRRELAEFEEKIQKHREEQRDLDRFPLFSSTAALLESVLIDAVPDSYLQDLASLLVEERQKVQDVIEETVEAAAEAEQPIDEAPLEAAYDAAGQNEAAAGLLEEYLQDGERLRLLMAYEAFLEPFRTLAGFAVPEQVVVEEPQEQVCPFCQTRALMEGGRCPSCRRILELAQPTSTAIGGPSTLLGSSYLNALDQRTSDLAADASAEELVVEWRGLSVHLLDMRTAATQAGQEKATLELLSELSEQCRQVANSLPRRSPSYAILREPLILGLSQLEHTVKNL